MPDKQSKVEVSRRFGLGREPEHEQGSLSGELGEKHRDSEGIHIHYKSGANRY